MRNRKGLFTVGILLVMVAIIQVALAAQDFPIKPGYDVDAEKTYAEIELERMSQAQVALVGATDSCSDINNDLNNSPDGFTVNQTLSGRTIVNDYTIDDSDPDISGCYSAPSTNTTGYRTAWYTFVAPATGILEVETSANFEYVHDYDTVVVLYEGNDCDNLTRIDCSDDWNGFLGRIDRQIVQGRRYYVEIADRNLNTQNEARLNVQIRVRFASSWEGSAEWNKEQAIRSRHSMVTDGEFLYVIAGQDFLDTSPPIAPERTASLARFEPATGEWVDLAPMPPACDFEGYSNTAAAYLEDSQTLNGKIYLPSGYVGDNSLYKPTHCIYDVETNTWSTGQSPPWADGLATAHAAVIARPQVNGYFVIGGLTGEWFAAPPDGQARTDSYFYSAAGDIWVSIAPLPIGLYGHSGALVGGQFLCVTGGLKQDPAFDGSQTIAWVINATTYCLDLNNQAAGWAVRGELNQERFNADSAIGPNGEWYILGGVTARPNDDGVNVPELAGETEVFDSVTGSWVELDRRYNVDEPARSWPQGEFVGDDLWVIGGEYDLERGNLPGFSSGKLLVGLVEKLSLPTAPIPRPSFVLDTSIYNQTIYAPIMIDGYASVLAGNGGNLIKDDKFEPDNSINTANILDFTGPKFRNFDYAFDRFDMFILDVNGSTYDIMLQNIPFGENYDIYVYNGNKVEFGRSENFLNQDEIITANMPYGRYYVLVVAQTNNPTIFGDYKIQVRRTPQE